MLITLSTNILVGILGGLCVALLTHLLLANLKVVDFFKMTFRSGTNLFVRKNDIYELKVLGIANFLSAIRIDNLINQIRPVPGFVSISRKPALSVSRFWKTFMNSSALTKALAGRYM